MADWFYADDCRTDEEYVFVRVMDERARGWERLEVSADNAAGAMRMPEGMLALFIDVCVSGLVVRTLRVEFHGTHALVGDDETMQWGRPLGGSRKNVTVIEDDDAARIAARAASWVEGELRRPIERREWIVAGGHHHQWALADTGEILFGSDSSNQRRDGLGPPDAIFIVRGVRLSR